MRTMVAKKVWCDRKSGVEVWLRQCKVRAGRVKLGVRSTNHLLGHGKRVPDTLSAMSSVLDRLHSSKARGQQRPAGMYIWLRTYRMIHLAITSTSNSTPEYQELDRALDGGYSMARPVVQGPLQ